ncbi:MAG: hypothetical protein Q7U74_01430, partial [Saprospiraceae bacterium]|nr:hypothetical protein [Saprospiraceae bacterium]
FSGVMMGLYSLRPEWLSPAGMSERLRLMKIGTAIMAAVAWLTVFTGTYIVYPWYRAKPPQGASLLDYPRSLLLSKPNLAGWHTFGMEWKEHVAWFCPILATVVCFVIWRYGDQIAANPKLRMAVAVVFVLAFSSAAIAGLFGAFITKAAPLL